MHLVLRPHPPNNRSWWKGARVLCKISQSPGNEAGNIPTQERPVFPTGKEGDGLGVNATATEGEIRDPEEELRKRKYIYVTQFVHHGTHNSLVQFTRYNNTHINLYRVKVTNMYPSPTYAIDGCYIALALEAKCA